MPRCTIPGVMLDRSYGSRAAGLAAESRWPRLLFANFDERLDQPGLLRRPKGDIADRVRKAGAVGDQAVDGDIASAHGRYDALEILGGGVTTSEQGHFLAVEIRIHEGDRVLDDAYEHVAAAMGHKLEALLHGRLVARSIKDHIKAIAMR